MVPGTRAQSRDPIPTAVFFLSPLLQVLDSIQVPPGSLGIREAYALAGETRIVVSAPPNLLCLDISTQRILAAVPMTPSEIISASNQPPRVYLTSGGWTVEGMATGLVREFSATLDSLATFRLPELPSGINRAGLEVVLSADGLEAYVLTGTPSISFERHHAEVVILDLQNRAVRAVIPLGDFGTALRLFRVSF